MKADILTKTWIAAILAIFCSALWGSAFPCVKIGYGLFGVDTSQTSVYKGYKQDKIEMRGD
ncbi:MAG: hypothetical protein ACLRHY_11140, partial [[Eubacterium] siraeum]